MKVKKCIVGVTCLIAVITAFCMSSVVYHSTNNATTNLGKTSERRKINTTLIGNYSLSSGGDIGAHKITISGIATEDLYCVDQTRYSGFNWDWNTSSYDDRPALGLAMGVSTDLTKIGKIQWLADHFVPMTSTDTQFDKEVFNWVLKTSGDKIENPEEYYNKLTENDKYAINQNVLWTLLDGASNGTVIDNFTPEAAKVNGIYFGQASNNGSYSRHTQNSVKITKENAVLKDNGVVGPFSIQGNGGAYKILVNASVAGNNVSAKLYKNAECTEEIGTIDNYTGDCYVKLDNNANGKIDIKFSIKHSYISLDRLWYTVCTGGDFLPQSVMQLERSYVTTDLEYSTEKKEELKGSFNVNLVKTGKDENNTSKVLPGARFRIIVKDGNDEIYNSNSVDQNGLVTDQNGRIPEISNLNISGENKNYTVSVEEISVPEGYIGISGVKTFTVKSIADNNKYKLVTKEKSTIENESNIYTTVRDNEIFIEVENTKKPEEKVITGNFKINLIKTGKDENNASTVLPGAKFRVIVKDGNNEIYNSSSIDSNGLVTDRNGKISTISNLNISAENKTYTVSVEELTAPEGYIGLSGAKTFTVKSVLKGDKYELEAKGKSTIENESNIYTTVKADEILIEVENNKKPQERKVLVPPEIHKGVKTVENQNSGYDKNELQTWVINTTVPEGISEYTKYVVTDTIDFEKTNIADKRIKFVDELNPGKNVQVKVKETGAILVENIDYKVEFSNAKELKVSFIDSKSNFMAGRNMRENSTLEITYKTQFVVENGKIKGLNQSIKNQAHLVFNMDGREEKQKDSEIPEVHTGAIGVFKYDERTKIALVGAHFKITKSKEEADKAVRAIINNDVALLNTVKFVKVIDENGNQTSKDIELITGEDGHAMVQGLEFGEDAINEIKNKTVDTKTGAQVYTYNWKDVKTTYYIIETEAPKGYTVLDHAEEVVVKYDSFEEVDLTKYNKIANSPKLYDLSLRKFITNVDGKEITDRIPKVEITDYFKTGKSTTCMYNHPKNTVMVQTNNIVTYTIRVYNEGPEDAYASIVKDDIPEGLEFVSYTNGDGSINAKYGWKLVDENDNEVTDKSKAKYIVTEFLSKENGRDVNLLKGFDVNTSKELDYREVKVQFKVVEPNTSSRILINYAQIAKMTDANGRVVTDRDSTPNKWINGEDDQDIEMVKLTYFDLALRKWVTKAIVTENGQTVVTETGHKAEDNPEEIVKVDLKKSNLNNVTVKFEYKIRVSNEGKIAGYADEVTDYIPNGLKFIAADNPTWTKVDEHTITTTELKNTLLNPGESSEVTVILTWENSADNIGIKKNIAEISKDRNDYGIKDIDSVPGNKKWGEDDIDDAPVMLSVKTGNQTIQYVLLGLAFVTILGIGVKYIKKVAA